MKEDESRREREETKEVKNETVLGNIRNFCVYRRIYICDNFI